MASFFQRCFFLFACLAMTQVCSGGDTSSAEKVHLDLYYETLCPFSANFIVNLLPTIFMNGLIDIVDLHFVPWGNALLYPNNTFICQHDKDECLLNTVQACTIYEWPKVVDQFNLIHCIENQVNQRKYTHWADCFPKSRFASVTTCSKGKQGQKLELKYANETDSLNPPHEYVPWVVVDHEPLKDDYENFVNYICKAYKGPPPNACKKNSHASVSKKKTNEAQYATYKEKATKV